MCRKIRCDLKYEKFCKIFWEQGLASVRLAREELWSCLFKILRHIEYLDAYIEY